MILDSKWVDNFRKILVPTIAAFLCFAFVVIKPLNDLGGGYGFLTYTTLLLAFFPGGKLTAQIEATILGILCVSTGLAWTTATIAIAAYCGRTYGPDGPQERAVLACGLASLALIYGFLRSRYAFLAVASRITMFFPIFRLTSVQAVTSTSAAYFLDQFYVSLFAAAFALLPCLIIGRRSSGPRLACLITSSLHVTADLLPLAISSILSDKSSTTSTSPVSPWHRSSHDLESAGSPIPLNTNLATQTKLVESLKATVTELKPTLDEYSIGIVHAKFHPFVLEPIIRSIQKTSRNPLLGETSHIPGERIRAALERSRAGSWTPPPSRAASRTDLRRGSSQHDIHLSYRGARAASTQSIRDLGKEEQSHSGRGHERKTSLIGLTITQPDTASSVPAWIRAAQIEWRLTSSTGSIPAPTVKETSLADECDQLASLIGNLIRRSSYELAVACGWESKHDKAEKGTERESIQTLGSHLEVALSNFQRGLALLLDGNSDEIARHGLSPHVPFPRLGLLDDKDHFRVAFYMTALLDLAKEALALSGAVLETIAKTDTKARFMLPRLPFVLKWSSKTCQADDGEYVARERKPSVNIDGSAGADPDEQEPADAVPDTNFDPADIEPMEQQEHQRPRTFAERVARRWMRIWNNPGTLKFRVALSHFIHELRHSRHVLFALKLSGGVALLSIPAFLPPGSDGRNWFAHSRGAWMVISYNYVLETHTGATFKVGFLRMIGTFLGAVAGYVCTKIAYNNPYALVTLGTVCAIPISYVVMFTNVPGVGTVTGITLPPLLFLTYLGEGDGQSEFELAWNRFVDIALGIVAAVLVGILVWPNHARVRYFHSVSGILERVTEYYLRMSRDNLRESLVYQDNQKQYEHLESQIRRDILLGRNLVTIQKNEVSLLPRPIKLYSEILDALERLMDSFAEVRTLRFSVPRKETVLDVLPIRRELVSSILISVWACSQSFRSRYPLPQYLPSPRVPLSELMDTVDDHARRVRRQRGARTSSGGTSTPPSPVVGGHGPTSKDGTSVAEELAILYGMAENEAVGEVCNIMEELVAAARTLFGTQTFLDTSTYHERSRVS